MLTSYVKEGVLCAEGTIEKYGRKVFVYLVDGMLIDSGPEVLLTELEPFFEEQDFDQVVFTHNHEDHTGNAAFLAENFQIPLLMNEKGISLCLADGEYPLYRQLIWGQRKAFTAKPISEVIRSKNLEWKVIYTPGHASDHVSFLNEETGRLFSGDLYVSPHTKVTMATESVKQMMDSLETLLACRFTHLYCSHAGYFPNGKEVLQQKLEKLREMSEKILQLDAEGLSVEDINDALFPGNYPIVLYSEREWDTHHTIRSVIKELKPLSVKGNHNT